MTNAWRHQNNDASLCCHVCIELNWYDIGIVPVMSYQLQDTSYTCFHPLQYRVLVQGVQWTILDSTSRVLRASLRAKWIFKSNDADVTKFLSSITPSLWHRLCQAEGLVLTRMCEIASFKGDLIQHQILIEFLLKDPFGRSQTRSNLPVWLPHATSAIESIAVTFLLLVASACTPLFCTSHNRRRNVRIRVDELAASAAGRVAKVAIWIRRQL